MLSSANQRAFPCLADAVPALKDIIDLYPRRKNNPSYPHLAPTYWASRLQTLLGIRLAVAQLKPLPAWTGYYLLRFQFDCFCFSPEGIIMNSLQSSLLTRWQFFLPAYAAFSETWPLPLCFKLLSFECQGNSCWRLQGMRTDVKFSCSLKISVPS